METSKSSLIITLIILASTVGLSWASTTGTSSSTNNNNMDAYEVNMRSECGFTRYPELCVQTLKISTSHTRNGDLVSALINKTIFETNLPYSYHDSLSTLSSSIPFISPDAQSVIDHCKELMKMSMKQLNQALKFLKKSPKIHKEDIQTWLSAALTYQETCKDAIRDLAKPDPYTTQISTKMDYLSQLTSNPLALINRISAPTRHRRLLTFPTWLSAKDRHLLESTSVKANAVVAKDGSGDYTTVAAAIQAASGGGFVIYVKAGRYSERINMNKDGITLIGDGKYTTIITAGRSVGQGSTLRGSATFSVSGDGFIARDIEFENTAGAESHQAVAINLASDRSVLYRCSATGYQDTLYAHSLRQFYRECDISGTVDFIFGNAAAVFQSCNLILRRPRSGGAFNTILASGRSDPGQNTGFSVQNSRISVGSDFSPVRGSYRSYLGRPWKPYARSVVMQTAIDGEIDPKGWIEWEGAGGSTYKTLYYAEYANLGPGAGTSARVGWPGFHVIGAAEAARFTVGSFIGGNQWLPSTGVTFLSGL